MQNGGILIYWLSFCVSGAKLAVYPYIGYHIVFQVQNGSILIYWLSHFLSGAKWRYTHWLSHCVSGAKWWYTHLSLGVKISASWLANKECIYAVFLQQSAVFNIFAVQYEISYTMPSFCAKRQFSLQIRGFLILFCLHLSVWLVSISCFRCDVRYQQKTWTSKSSVCLLLPHCPAGQLA